MNNQEPMIDMSAQNLQQRQREYINAIMPYVNQKENIFKVVLPKVTIHSDGTIEHDYQFTAAQEELIRLLDEAIVHIKTLFESS